MKLQYNQINNRDMAKEINFFENKIYVGTFTVLSQEFTGKLIYESGNRFELILYDTPSIYELTKSSSIKPVIDNIIGRIYDDKETYYNVVLVNCNCLKTHLWGKGCLKINFEYALFSETHIFELDNDKNFTLDVYFDNWNEFCYPQGFKSLVTVSNEHKLSVTLKNRLKVLFEENISAEFINTEDLFSNCFVSSCENGLKKEEIEKLNKKFKELLKPYKLKIFKKRDDTHRWFISIKNIPNIKSVSKILWKINMLINLLTYDFGTNIEFIKIKVDTDDKINPVANFYYLFKKNKQKKIRYRNTMSAFQCKMFSNDEWKLILNNLFDKKQNNWLTYFFYVLIENNSSNSLSIFHITRYIDYIGAIGSSRNYGKNDKYKKVITDFIDSFDDKLKNAILNLFRENLLMIKIKQETSKNLKSWNLIGRKLSEFRAYSAHAQKEKRVIPFYNAYEVYKILELIIIDYVFELLEVSQDKRLQYKNYYITQLVGNYIKLRKEGERNE